jgi:hypothetical protein
MAQGKSGRTRSSRPSDHDDLLVEIREAVRSDRRKIASLPLVGLELKTTSRGPSFSARKSHAVR